MTPRHEPKDTSGQYERWLFVRAREWERVTAVHDLATLYTELGVLTLAEAMEEIRRLRAGNKKSPG